MSCQVNCGRCVCSLVLRRRYITCIMVWFSLILINGSRFSIRNIRYLEKIYDSNTSNIFNICEKYRLPNVFEKPVKTYFPTWSFNPDKIEVMMYWYRAGYMIGHLPVGLFCDLYGSRHFLSFGLLAAGLINSVMPIMLERVVWMQLAVLQFIFGIFQGFCRPAAFCLLAHWIPNYQLTVLVAAVSASSIGRVLSTLVAVYFTNNLLYWPGAFYFWTVASFVFYLAFINSVFSSPATHPFINQEEKQQLTEEFGSLAPCRIPWRNILRDGALWAIVSARVGHRIIESAVVVSFPVFAFGLYNVKPALMPYYGLIPSLLPCAVSITGSILGNYLIKRDIVPTIYLRSMFVAMGNILSPIFLLLITFMDCHRGMSVICFVCALICKSLYFAVISATVIDRTRHYAGFYGAIANCVPTIFDPISEHLIGKISEGKTMNAFSKVFYFTIAISIFTTVIYLVWNKGERAKWDVTESKEQVRRMDLQK